MKKHKHRYKIATIEQFLNVLAKAGVYYLWETLNDVREYQKQFLVLTCADEDCNAYCSIDRSIVYPEMISGG